jgi:hypothetical protein
MVKGAKYGAAAGILAWLLGGILIGVHIGGFGAVSLLSKLSGGPVESDLLSRAFILIGMLVGVVCTGTSAVVVGALCGGLLGSTLARNAEVSPSRA